MCKCSVVAGVREGVGGGLALQRSDTSTESHRCVEVLGTSLPQSERYPACQSSGRGQHPP